MQDAAERRAQDHLVGALEVAEDGVGDQHDVGLQLAPAVALDERPEDVEELFQAVVCRCAGVLDHREDQVVDALPARGQLDRRLQGLAHLSGVAARKDGLEALGADGRRLGPDCHGRLS